MAAVAERDIKKEIREMRAVEAEDKTVEFGSLAVRAKFKFGGRTYEKGEHVDRGQSRGRCLSDPAFDQSFHHNARVEIVS